MKVLLLFLLFPAAFCKNTKHEAVVLKVVNKSKKNIDSVIIRSYNVNEKFIRLYPDSLYKRNITIEPPDNTEGGFTIAIYQKDSMVYANSFGYFLNANWIRNSYTVTIAADYTIREEQ
jgi:DNA phosphorothioation-dependent restriction protein DptG